MGLIDIIKPLSIFLSNVVSKSKQHQDKNSWECQEPNPGPLGEKQEYYLCAVQKLSHLFFLSRASASAASSQVASDLLAQLENRKINKINFHFLTETFDLNEKARNQLFIIH